MLSGVEAIHVATVLEDCVDQLAILGRIMPASYEEKPDADEVRPRSSSSVQFKLTCSCSRFTSKTKRMKSHRLPSSHLFD